MTNRYARQTLLKMNELISNAIKWRILSLLANVFYTDNHFSSGPFTFHGCNSFAHRRETTGSQENIRKRRLFKKVQAFCEEKVLRYLLGVFW